MQSQTMLEEAALLAGEQLLAGEEQAASKAAPKKAKKGKQKAKRQLNKQLQDMAKQQQPEDHAQPPGTSAQQSSTDSTAAAVLQHMDQLQLGQSATNGLHAAQTIASDPAAQSLSLPAEPTEASQAALALPTCEPEAHSCANDAEDVSHIFCCPLTKVQHFRTASFRSLVAAARSLAMTAKTLASIV